MKEKTKTQADRKLIKDVFACDPIDWARYPDGRLSFISPTGQKFSYNQVELDNIAEAVRLERAGKKKLSRKKAKSSEAETDLNSEVDAAAANKNRFGGRGGVNSASRMRPPLFYTLDLLMKSRSPEETSIKMDNIYK